MKLPIVITVLIGILVVACSSAAPAPVEPTPIIWATVEARAKELVAAPTTPINTLAPTDTPFSQESQAKLDQYSDSFNPLLEKHQRLFKEEFGGALAEAEESGNRISQSSNPNQADAMAVIERLTKALDNIRRELQEVNTEWSVLYPPPEAKRFHNLTFEYMQLRLQTVERSLHAYNMLATGMVELSRQALLESHDLMQQADRLFLDVLAEARTLGNVEIIRD